MLTVTPTKSQRSSEWKKKQQQQDTTVCSKSCILNIKTQIENKWVENIPCKH